MKPKDLFVRSLQKKITIIIMMIIIIIPFGKLT